MRQRGLREKRGGTLVYERKEWENGSREGRIRGWWWGGGDGGYEREVVDGDGKWYERFD